MTGHNLLYPLLTWNTFLLVFSVIDVGSPNWDGVKRVYFCETPLPPVASILEVKGFHKTLPTTALSIYTWYTYFGRKF